jgi:hypothetical protein
MTENIKRFENVRKNLSSGKYETRFATFGMCLFIGLLLIAVGHIYSLYTAQQDKLVLYALQQNKMTQYIIRQEKLLQAANQQEKLAQYTAQQQKLAQYDAQQKELKTAIENNRKIYVYSLEDVLLKVDILDNKKKFEEEVIKLNDELLEGEKKIKSIKNAKVKEDFSDVYLKNLRMKRDELLADYQKIVEELTEKINQALAEIAKEKQVSVVFLKSAIAVQTPDVIDLTDEIAARVKNNSKK